MTDWTALPFEHVNWPPVGTSAGHQWDFPWPRTRFTPVGLCRCTLVLIDAPEAIRFKVTLNVAASECAREDRCATDRTGDLGPGLIGAEAS